MMYKNFLKWLSLPSPITQPLPQSKWTVCWFWFQPFLYEFYVGFELLEGMALLFNFVTFSTYKITLQKNKKQNRFSIHIYLTYH